VQAPSPEEFARAAQAIVHGDPAAEPLLRDLCRRFPGNAGAHFLLGALLDRLGRVEEALAAMEQSLAIDADGVQALSARASLLLRLGRAGDAQAHLEAATRRQPANAQLWFNFGAALEASGDFTGALAAYDSALALPDAPPEVLMNRGYALARLGRIEEAVENNARLTERLPRNADAHFNLADVLLAARRPQAALAASVRALEIAPDHARARIASGLALAQMGRIDEARAAFEQVRIEDPEALRTFVNIFDTAPWRGGDRFDPELIHFAAGYDKLLDCDWSERDELIERCQRLVRERSQAGTGPADPSLAYDLLTLPVPAATRRAAARGLASRIESRARPPLPFASKPSPGKRLRIGYFSPDFRDHLNAYLLHPLVRLHDRSSFEVFCYSTGPSDRSAIRAQVMAAADGFIDVAALDDERIATRIREDGIDVLVDAGGFTTYARPGAMALRAAPVQVGYLAFPGTQGMDAVPYRIVDRIACPPEQQQDWTEALVYLPDTFFIYDRFEPLAAPSISRSEYGLPDAAFVFCCFNNYYKIEPGIFGVWMNILRNVPGSVLWLAGRNAAAASNLRREALQRGVAADRLVFAPFEPRDRYRARFALADLFLDTPIFNAMTTACDALAAGLPLLTAPGREFPSRVAASLLTAAGFTAGIVESMEAYRLQAIAWGKHRDSLDALRRQCLSQPLSTPLFDTEARVRQLEQAYREMWRRYCGGLPPESFDVVRTSPGNWINRWH
jgi:predicted O-linked N-acetylglucosamine transferase (SPINDLY family)